AARAHGRKWHRAADFRAATIGRLFGYFCRVDLSGGPGVVVVDGGAQEVLDAVAGLSAGALDEGRWPTLSWCDNEILAEHRFPFPVQDAAAGPSVLHNELQVCVASSRPTDLVGLNAGGERGGCRTGCHGVFRRWPWCRSADRRPSRAEAMVQAGLWRPVGEA